MGRENRSNLKLNIQSNYKTITLNLYHYIQNLQKINIPINAHKLDQILFLMLTLLLQNWKSISLL